MRATLKNLLALFIIAGTLNTAATCGDKTSGSSDAGNSAVNEASVQSLDLAGFEKKITEPVQLLDVRTAEEYKGGHVAGSVNIDVNSSDFSTRIATLDKTKPVVVYCLSGGRSPKAAEQLLAAGFTQVYNYGGGMLEWRAAGKPETKEGTVSNTPAVNTNTVTPTPAGQSNTLKPLNMSTADYKAKTASKNYVLVDYNASWCGPCRMIKPYIEKVTAEHKTDLLLLDIDVDKNTELAGFKKITSIPYLELYKDGKLVWSQLGALSEAEFRAATGL